MNISKLLNNFIIMFRLFILMVMELRKVQTSKSGTYFISLPKRWAEKNGIKRGSVIATSETADGRLIIDPGYNRERVPLITVTKPSPHLERDIIGKYLLGYDVIRIEAKDRINIKDRERVKKTSSKLIGLEIIEENHANIVLQCLLEPSALPPDKILRREQSISLSMHKDAVTALIEGDVQLAHNVIDRDDEVDRLYFLLVRILRTIIQNPYLSEKLNIYPIDCLDYRLASSLVEAIGDLSAQIAQHTIDLGGTRLDDEISKALLRLHGLVYEAHQDAVTSFLTCNVTLANSVRERREEFEEVYRMSESLSNTKPPKIASSILSIISLLSQVYDDSVDISDLTIPRAK